MVHLCTLTKMKVHFICDIMMVETSYIYQLLSCYVFARESIAPLQNTFHDPLEYSWCQSYS